MTQLSFQPALDPLHAIYRLLRLREVVREAAPLELEHVRVLDFYLIFPFKISEIRLRREDKEIRRVSNEYAAQKPYGNQPEGVVLFERMRPMQKVALQTLALRGFTDSLSFKAGLLKFTGLPTPLQISDRIREANVRDRKLLDALTVFAYSYEFHGPNGLKARTGLLEYRYDAV
jgi:hypothetical protein